MGMKYVGKTAIEKKHFTKFLFNNLNEKNYFFKIFLHSILRKGLLNRSGNNESI